MTEDDTERESGHTGEGETEEHPTLASGVSTPDDMLGEPHLEEGGDDEWPVRGPAKGLRLTIPTAGIAVVLLVAAGFWGGAVLEKHHSGSSGSSAASIAARFRSGLRGAATGTGTTTTGTGGSAAAGGGFGAAASSAAAGTVSVVDGKTLYILTTTGSLVKVTLGASTTITRDATTKAVDLRPGDTVVVQGTTAKNGDVAATSVSATAPGITAGG